MITIVKDSLPQASIIVEQEPTASFAAEELQAYVFKISGCQLPIKSESEIEGQTCLMVGSVSWCKKHASCDIDGDSLTYDGFILQSFEQGLIMTSHAGRGILYAVYALLERMGCRWFFAGELGEVIPSKQDIRIEALNLLDNPDFEYRGLTEDACKSSIASWCEEMKETIDWCGKNKINSFHIHWSPASPLEGIDEVVREIKKRGMRYECGGHGAELLLDREWFEHKPYLFREKAGIRVKDGNLCASNEEGIERLVEGAKALLVNHPEIDLLHMWFADVSGGSWCECGSCRDIHPATQQLRVINRIGKGLCQLRPELEIDMPLYHDSVEASNMTCDPESNVYGFFAGRERCYAHSISDDSCQLNQWYNRLLEEAYLKFRGNMCVYGYYADMILFAKLKINIPHVITDDLKHYRKKGIPKVAALMFGRFSWRAYASNLYVFGRAAWNTNFPYSEGLAELYKRYFPEIPNVMMEYHRLIERASYGLLTFCGYSDSAGELSHIPSQPHDFRLKHIEQMARSLGLYRQGLSLLETHMDTCVGKAGKLLADEKDMLLITIKEAEAIYNRISQ